MQTTIFSTHIKSIIQTYFPLEATCRTTPNASYLLFVRASFLFFIVVSVWFYFQHLFSITLATMVGDACSVHYPHLLKFLTSRSFTHYCILHAAQLRAQTARLAKACNTGPSASNGGTVGSLCAGGSCPLATFSPRTRNACHDLLLLLLLLLPLLQLSSSFSFSSSSSSSIATKRTRLDWAKKCATGVRANRVLLLLLLLLVCPPPPSSFSPTSNKSVRNTGVDLSCTGLYDRSITDRGTCAKKASSEASSVVAARSASLWAYSHEASVNRSTNATPRSMSF